MSTLESPFLVGEKRVIFLMQMVTKMTMTGGSYSLSLNFPLLDYIMCCDLIVYSDFNCLQPSLFHMNDVLMWLGNNSSLGGGSNCL